MNIDVLKNIGLGGMTGYADSAQDRGWYIPQFQYAGNGLAKNSMQYFANPDYRDYTSGGMALGSVLGNGNNSGSSLGGRLKSLFGKQAGEGGQSIEDINNPNLFGNNYGLPVQGYQIPDNLKGFLGPNIYGQPNVLGGGEMGNYTLPVQQSYSRPSWLK